NFEPTNTNNAGTLINYDKSDDAFWGAKVDWQVNDSNLIELLAFSDEDTSATDVYAFDYTTGQVGDYQNTVFFDSGGVNWSATYTSYLADNFSVRAMYGENERKSAQYTPNDIECNRIRDLRENGTGDVGCTSNSSVISRTDVREQARLDFEWALGDHLVRFGVDREVNTSNHLQHYPGPDRLVYEINGPVVPGSTLPNDAIVPPGVTEYVRTRTNEVDGKFETASTAFYLEDSWQITDNLVIDAGLRLDELDNKDSDKRSYIKMDGMLAPRLGFAWDMRGDARSKLFGNAGRYFLPMANVINIKQAGGFADVRTFYELLIFVIDAGLRLDEFDNKDSDKRSYIKMDGMLAPRLGFAWDMRGDARSKLFGNAGRYFLPMANVINIKQAGGFADVRTFYEFLGF